jgi:hypothetical protein
MAILLKFTVWRFWEIEAQTRASHHRDTTAQRKERMLMNSMNRRHLMLGSAALAGSLMLARSGQAQREEAPETAAATRFI